MDGGGGHSRARFQIPQFRSPPRSTVLCSWSRARRRSCLPKHRGSKQHKDGPQGRVENTHQDGRVQNRASTLVRGWRRDTGPISRPRRRGEQFCMAPRRRRQSGRTKDEQKYVVMRLARLEQASFGTGIRRASHCATTPTGIMFAFCGRQSIRKTWHFGASLGVVVRGYKLWACWEGVEWEVETVSPRFSVYDVLMRNVLRHHTKHLNPPETAFMRAHSFITS